MKKNLNTLMKSGKSPIVIVLGTLLGLALVLSFPLALIFGLKLLGFEHVQLDTSSYCGSLLILFFLSVAQRIGSPAKQEDDAESE